MAEWYTDLSHLTLSAATTLYYNCLLAFSFLFVCFSNAYNSDQSITTSTFLDLGIVTFWGGGGMFVYFFRHLNFVSDIPK